MNVAATILATAVAAVSGAAAQTDAVPTVFHEAAELYGIEGGEILYAIALNESGRSVDGAFRPWPWTLNVEGRGYYYDSQDEAWAALSEFIAAGHRSIDVGLMQVNFRWHEELLVDPYTALDPWVNVHLGASVYADVLQGDDPVAAAGRYHSPGPSAAQRQRADRYSAKVRHHLASIGADR